MSEEEKTTDHGQLTTDNTQQNNEESVNNENTDDNLSSKKPITEKEQTQNRKSQTKEEMEVQHHSHPPHGKKTWAAYFWEFLMLFLAVFCGFLAEYQLEHVIEKERGKQYIESLYEDLQTDTTKCAKQITELTEKESSLMVMDACFDSLIHGITSPDCLKTVVKNSRGFSDFIYTDRTIQQLKFAGGLRLIQDKEIADSIIAYDAMVREMLIHQGVLENIQQIAINAHNSMLGYIALSGKITLINTDIKDINKYFNEIRVFRSSCVGQLHWLNEIKAKATRLLIFLDKKEKH